MKKAKILIVVCILFILSGCDAGLEIAQIQINQYPNRITYYKGIDSKLDLGGLEILLITKDGSKNTEKLDDDFEQQYYDIIENVNFESPGVYVITIERHTSSCSFPIEVIDPSNIIE